jgi:hypothetical protein
MKGAQNPQSAIEKRKNKQKMILPHNKPRIPINRRNHHLATGRLRCQNPAEIVPPFGMMRVHYFEL